MRIAETLLAYLAACAVYWMTHDWFIALIAVFFAVWFTYRSICSRPKGTSTATRLPDEPESVCVFRPWTPQESVLVESILSGSGIPYHIENEKNARGAVFALADGATRVLVPASRAEEARKLLASLRDSKS